MPADRSAQRPSSEAAAGQDRSLVVDLSRDLVETLAPEELVVFPAVSAAFFDDPKSLDSKATDTMLGSGVEGTVVLLTPVVMAVMAEVTAFLRSELPKALPHVVGTVAEEGIRTIFRKFHKRETAAPALTRDQLDRIRSIVFEVARLARLSERQARLLADAVIGSLVVDP